ncbi:selenide,water dikinase [Helicobacter mustelae]|uniref:Selenide,water dikinase n=1 Tax=Helicobacter mustelae (strain ATCC 43772 / CCUG 25715 / CIP 103759 / LMG 18044 / NCTC 12198 / R85-136P) TaxID=679897 RepID=D3UHV7_HELM1|nr:selenide,water dikinase [Helicobacter mustelae 12198]SQH71594.1 selenide,water dikinase [Helicobacter mustelae]STP12718.1 selenide,water dikinase [Helicobacter mustelae]
MIAGFEHHEDCGIYALENGDFLLQSIDFITPIVDDPYFYGKIAAANALSDVFAKGAEVCTALNVLMWDREHVSKSCLQEILRGGMEKIKECGALLLGGHTINDREQKYGLSVSGITRSFWPNRGAKIGDVLLLCKPIGSGIITTALKRENLALSAAKECVESMALLNVYAMRIALDFPIHASTDITGFGLIGHLLEMCAEEQSFALEVDKIPLFEPVKELLAQNISLGSKNNRAYFSHAVRDTRERGEDGFLYDAQTSGGIVFALPKNKAWALLDALKKSQYERASIIGEVIPRAQGAILLG